MKRLRSTWAVLAVVLAALLPLEQAHCLWMAPASGKAACAPASESSDHSCCAPAPNTGPQHQSAPSDCPCIQLPSGTLPAATAPTWLPASQLVAWVEVTTFLTAEPAVSAPAPALDVGSPPLLIAVDAHGLRAPPLSA